MEWQIDALSYGQLAHLHYFREVNDAHFNHCLQMHTYYSDGKYSPAELLHYAASIGLETMAIADHDNANGVREALPLA